MSTILMSACWPLQMPPTPKAVLISLADNANDAGECWPSLTKISERTCVCRRSVIEAIHWLEDAGYVRADRTNGRHTRYFVTAEPRLFEDAKPVRQMHQCGKRTSAAGSPTGAPDARDPCAKRTLTVNNHHEPSRSPARAQEATGGNDDFGPVTIESGDAGGSKPKPKPGEQGRARIDPALMPTPGAAACVAMREAGMPVSRLNPSHPALLEALSDGVKPAELADVARELISRGTGPPSLAYVVQTARGRRRDAQQQVENPTHERHPNQARQPSRARSAVGRQLEAIQRRRAREAAGDDAAGSVATGQDG